MVGVDLPWFGEEKDKKERTKVKARLQIHLPHRRAANTTELALTRWYVLKIRCDQVSPRWWLASEWDIRCLGCESSKWYASVGVIVELSELYSKFQEGK